MRHLIGTSSAEDQLVYHEKDPSNYIGVGKTKSEKYIMVVSKATLSSEVSLLNADRPTDLLVIFQPRIKEVIYSVDHANESFYIRTNKEAKNFKIVTCNEDNTGVSYWKELIAHQKEVLISGFELFKNFIAINERKNGLTQIHVVNTINKESHFLAFDEPTYVAGIGSNPEYDTNILRFNYTSLTTPSSVYDYNMDTKEKN